MDFNDIRTSDTASSFPLRGSLLGRILLKIHRRPGRINVAGVIVVASADFVISGIESPPSVEREPGAISPVKIEHQTFTELRSQ